MIKKISFQKAGGTAGKNSFRYRLDLPSSFVRSLGVTADCPYVNIYYDTVTNSIVICKKE